MKRLLLVLTLVACGGDDDNSTIDAPTGTTDGGVDAPLSLIDAPSSAFALTSPSLAEGALFDAANTCNGANTSPQLDWTDPPADTLGYAIVFTDKSQPNGGLIHWVIYDIPAASNGLPASVQTVFAPANVAGARQTLSYDNQTRGYLGPCPPSLHTYEFKLFALDVATLPGTTMQTSRAQAAALIDQHDLASTTLTGMYDMP